MFQFASGRPKICSPQLSTISGNLTTPQTLFFYIQYRNDVGYNLPSDTASVTYSTGQGIRITLPADCKRTGENILQYSITVNTIDDASTAKVILNIDASDLNLPTSIDLTEDSHIALEETVTTFPTLPTLINGQVKHYQPTGLIYRYKSTSTQTPNGTTVLPAATGAWEKTVDGFVSFVQNMEEDTNGADLNVLDIIDPEQVISKSYALDGSAGPERTYWLRNNTTETISQGARVGFTVSVNDQPVSEQFESLIKIVFDGYVDPQDGLLDITLADGTTPMQDLGIAKDYQFGRTDFILQKPLGPGEAYQVRIYPQFNSYELQSVPLAGTKISVLGFFFDEAGSYNDAAAVVGNTILPDNPSFRRVYPSSGLSVFADEGSGTVAGFFFKDIGSNIVPGLINNLANQQIVINNNGSVYLNDASLESNEDIRAIVSTELGESATSSFSAQTVDGDDSPTLTIEVPYPTSIRSDYQDVIAGADNKGTFNAEEIPIYVRKGGGEIRKFTGVSPTNVTSDTFTISWANGTVVPEVNSTPFGLWEALPPTTVTTTTPGAIPFEVAVGFSYLGNSVTGITHKESDGVIPELTLSLGEMSSAISGLQQTDGFWKEPVSSYAGLQGKLVSSLREGQANRVAGGNPDTYEIWTWDSASTATTDNSSTIRPDEYIDDTSAGRWIKISGGGDGSSNVNLDHIVTYQGHVVVDPTTGNVVTSTEADPTLPGDLSIYGESAIVGGDRLDLTDNLSMTDSSNYALSLEGGTSDRQVILYNGGEHFRKHIVINRGTTNNLTVVYQSNTISTVLPGENNEILWDTVNWISL